MGKTRKSVLYNPTKQIVSVCLRYSSFAIILTRHVDYDQYYASLAASADPSTRPTPGMSEFGEEEEDVKPNVEYLDSLNEYRKRSRSRDDIGTGGSTPKLPRTNSHMEIHEAADVGVAAVNGFGHQEDGQPSVNGAPAEDPIVYGRMVFCRAVWWPVLTRLPVNGKPVALSQVTEEHQEEMTPEEYTAYYELLSAQS